MFGERPAGEFGRVLLFTGEQRGGPDGGPVCRFLFNTRSGALYDLGRIDCFAVEPHHHTQLPRLDPGLDSPQELRTDLAPPGRRLGLEEWERCALAATDWLAGRFAAELRDGGWPGGIVDEVSAALPALVPAVRRHLLEHPPTGLAPGDGNAG